MSSIHQESKEHSAADAGRLNDLSDNPAQGAEGSVDETQSDKPFDSKEWAGDKQAWYFATEGLELPQLNELHQASLDQDTKQCTAWKEEVQNLLILAGLFSAIVTAFVIQSYQTLLPDPNDQIISLLSRIADQTSVHPTNTSAIPSSLPTTLAFDPTPSSVRVNIYWFISLVLSLTVALIGIITLQWLREHQLYKANTETIKAFPILNARREGLERWYVPQIFASLPLLLQAALVLFFFGLVEFLFSINSKVAIPVLSAVAVPILFLVATTIIPTLQLYSLHLPDLLRLNDNAPAPCPYKSPQSLIFQRSAIASTHLFNLSVWVFGIVYFPFIATIRLLVRTDKPFYGESAPFRTVNNYYHRSCNRLRRDAVNWISMDVQWLSARTSYKMAVHTWTRPLLHLWVPDYDAGTLAVHGLYDWFIGIKSDIISSDPTDYSQDSNYSAIWSIIQRVYWNSWNDLGQQAAEDPEAANILHAHLTSWLRIINPDHSYFYEKVIDMCREDVFQIANVFFVAFGSPKSGSEFDLTHSYAAVWVSRHLRLIVLYLFKNPREVFLCQESPSIAPNLSLSPGKSLLYHRDFILQSNVKWMAFHSRGCTEALRHIIEDARNSSPQQPFTGKCTKTSTTRCGSNLHTESIVELTVYFLLFQIPEDIRDTLQLFDEVIGSKPNPIQDHPLVLLLACAYINALANVHQDHTAPFQKLLRIICNLCGGLDPVLEARRDGTGRHWPEMEAAFKYIRGNCLQSSKEDSSALVQTSDAPNNVGAEQNV